MITLTIDGEIIETESGTTVLQAALRYGMDIPHLCYHPELSIVGSCRLCMVEVEGQDSPVISCSLACEKGMIVHTESEQLASLRRDILDLLLSSHPLDCIVCDKNGACLLQEYAYRFGGSEVTQEFKISRSLYQDDNPFFIRDHQYCILCGRCVRVCNEIVGATAIDYVGRGFESHIGTPFDGDMVDSPCVFCGSCVQVCPTAALMPVSRKGKGREWELDRVTTICGYCGVGCQVEYAVKENDNGSPDVVYAQSTHAAPVNGEFLCTKGRYGWDFASSPERLTQPLIRRDVAYTLGLTDEAWELPETSPLKIRKPKIGDSHVPVDWDTVLNLVAERLSETVRTHGPDSVMGLASARCTNEENYVFQKFFRAGIGTNNLDHCARL